MNQIILLSSKRIEGEGGRENRKKNQATFGI
jgi:hypothetical protein